MADEGRLSGIVEDRPDRIVRAFSLKEEYDLAFGQENGVPVESCCEFRVAESRMSGEKFFCSLTTIGLKARNKDEAIHDGSLLSQ